MTADWRRGVTDARLTAHTVTTVTADWLDENGDPWTPTGPVAIWLGGTLSPDPTDLDGADSYPGTPGDEPNQTVHVIDAGDPGAKALRVTVGGEVAGLGRAIVQSAQGTPHPSQEWTVSLGEHRAVFRLGGGMGGGGGAPEWGAIGGTLTDQADLSGALAGKADTSSLAPVATTGDYGDLNGTPTLGTAASADTDDFATAAQGQTADAAVQPGDLSPVATTGSYNDLIDTPAAPGAPEWGDIGGTLADQADLTGALDAKADDADLSPVAKTGSYGDLTGTPTIPSTPQEVGADPAGTAAGLVGGLAPVAQTGDYSDLTNTPPPLDDASDISVDPAAWEGEADNVQDGLDEIAATFGNVLSGLDDVAWSGDYSDLGNTPTLGTAAAADTGDFASAAQGQTADTALQPADLSGTGLATYDDQTGVIDVAASAVESIAEAEASDAVMALPEPVGSASIGVDDATPGLLRFSRRVLRLPPGDASNPSGEQSILNPAGQPVIPAGVLEMAGAYALLDIAGVASNNSGGPRELTLRVKLTSDPEGTPVTVTPFEFVLPDIESLGVAALHPWRIQCVVAFGTFFSQPVTTGQGSCELAHPTTGVVETSLLRPPPLGQIVADPATTPYRVGLTAEMDSGASTEVGCSTAFLRFMEPA